LTTAWLVPTKPLADERRRQILEHEKEADRLYRLMDSVEYGIVALTRRIQATETPQLRAGLEHSNVGLEQYYGELDEQAMAHTKAIVRLHRQE